MAPDEWSSSSGDLSGTFTEVLSRVSEAPAQLVVTDAEGRPRPFTVVPDCDLVAEMRHQALWMDGEARHRRSADWLSLHYLVGAAVHRLAALVDQYVGSLREGTRLADASSSTRFQMSVPEIYYEFEGVVADVIRVYEISRRHLWTVFGGGGSRPRKFLTVVEAIRADAPWLDGASSGFAELKEYRDCFTHDASAAEPAPRTIFERGPYGWWLTAMIPDNPKARSHRKFRFDEKHDALQLAMRAVAGTFEYVEALDQACRESGAF